MTTVSSTLVRSNAERLMTRRMSLVAIRYSCASCSSRQHVRCPRDGRRVCAAHAGKIGLTHSAAPFRSRRCAQSQSSVAFASHAWAGFVASVASLLLAANRNA